MSLAKQILGQIVADHGGMSSATGERVGRILRHYMNRDDLLIDISNSVGDWFAWNTDEKVDFIDQARREWNPR